MAQTALARKITPLSTPPRDAEISALPARKRDKRPLGQILLEDGAVTPAHLLKAVVMRQRQNARLGEILLAQGWITPDALTRALCRQWHTGAVDLVKDAPDPRLIDSIGPEICLAQGMVPWRRIGGVIFIATARPDCFETLKTLLPADFGPLRMVLASEAEVHDAILASRQTALIRRAESKVEAGMSCRSRNEKLTGRIALGSMAALALGFFFAPVVTFSLLTFWAAFTLLAAMVLKTLSFRAALRETADRGAVHRALAEGRLAAPEMKGELPVISMMVPLFNESDIAERLVARLSRLSYPRELTDLLLVVEETDTVTCNALDGAVLPSWIRVVKVPDGPIKTKPRALNYALNFCRGQIVGIWDAEDRPEPDQLHKAARRFATAPADVACLQGVLDYYNPRTNWLARCFTVEYASWFRANLPGIARMGLVVPLGGTTLFFRRDILEQVGGWDAWNVTEDADLGVRLARRGYRTEILDTVTHEEANCRALPWVKQRSRWLKGYAMTWGVHMRDPAALWRDLGARRFIGFQVQFLGTISQYLLAPVLWSFWLLSFGLPHPMREPLAGVWGGWAVPALFTLFVASEILNIVVALCACRGKDHRHLVPWVPSLHFYYPLGCLAGWKAIYEVVTRPFYWDKTVHGLFDHHDADDAPAPEAPPALPAGNVAVPVIGPIG